MTNKWSNPPTSDEERGTAEVDKRADRTHKTLLTMEEVFEIESNTAKLSVKERLIILSYLLGTVMSNDLAFVCIRDKRRIPDPLTDPSCRALSKWVHDIVEEAFVSGLQKASQHTAPVFDLMDLLKKAQTSPEAKE